MDRRPSFEENKKEIGNHFLASLSKSFHIPKPDSILSITAKKDKKGERIKINFDGKSERNGFYDSNYTEEGDVIETAFNYLKLIKGITVDPKKSSGSIYSIKIIISPETDLSNIPPYQKNVVTNLRSAVGFEKNIEQAKTNTKVKPDDELSTIKTAWGETPGSRLQHPAAAAASNQRGPGRR